MTKLYLETILTKIGQLTVVADEKYLLYIGLTEEPTAAIKDRLGLSEASIESSARNSITNKAREQIEAYLSKKLKQFDLPIKIIGTDFQKLVLKRVAKIPYGSTMSYGEIARQIGSSGAARAVGTTMATNRLPLIIPCHRVLASSGLGGYGGGLPMKEQLLKLEKENAG